MKSIYIETTIPSYIVSRGSRDEIVAGRQAATVMFWENERHKYELYVSQYVIDECSQGDDNMVKRRLALLKDIPIINETEQLREFSNIYCDLLKIPKRAKVDSLHLAACVTAGIDYLLSWNLAHLGIHTFIKLKEYNDKHSLHTPILTTPNDFIMIDKEEVNYG